MFQTYDAPGGPAIGRKNLPKLRKTLVRMKLDGFLVPHEDEYQNEYVPEALDRLAWVTGFTGSAGAAVVLADKAAVLVDGRYTIQAKAQVDQGLFQQADLVELGIGGWLAEHAPKGARIGYDPRLFSPDALARLRDTATRAGFLLAPVEENPVDIAWGAERPPVPATRATPHPDRYTGETSGEKRKRLGAELAKAGAEAAVITSPDSVAWLFNIRGADVARKPLALAAAILHADGRAELFIAPERTSAELSAWLGNEVAVAPETALEPALLGLGGKTVSVDPAIATAWHFDRLEKGGAKILRAMDPVMRPRACKNAVEIEGARRAHARDGAALTRFLHWLATEGQSGKVDEIEACKRLEAFRREIKELRDLSFDSISGAGPNGALPHYRVNESTNRKLKRGSLFLIDSGGQYLDGTTDVTRTVAIGRPSPEMKDRFTRVLQGHIALARVRFPKGTTGSALDALARLRLWEAGLDYDHGTGHGVGSYLGVHEGPHRISKAPNTVALEPGMIVSNEPGFYLEGQYGIRTENLQVVTPPAPVPGGDREMLGFETLTFAPIDRTLILRRLLSAEERAWLDAYHARVREVVAPQVGPDVQDWLEEVTRPI